MLGRAKQRKELVLNETQDINQTKVSNQQGKKIARVELNSAETETRMPNRFR